MRRRFYQCMWLLYVTIVGLSALVASLRFAMGEDGTLHHFISTTSNHLVLVTSHNMLLACSTVLHCLSQAEPMPQCCDRAGLWPKLTMPCWKCAGADIRFFDQLGSRQAFHPSVSYSARNWAHSLEWLLHACD